MFSALLICSITSLDCLTTARASSAGMMPTFRTPASARPSASAATTGVLATANDTPMQNAEITTSCFISHIVSSSLARAGLPAFLVLSQLHDTGMKHRQRSPPHVDILHPRIADDFVEALLLADSALLPAAIGRADIATIGIDPDVSRLNPFRGLHRLGEVVGDDRCGKTVFDRVHLPQHVLVVDPGHDRHHRAEYLLPAYAHGRSHFVENRRSNEQSGGERGIGGFAAAREQLRSVRLGPGNEAHDAVELTFRYNRSDLVLFEPWGADRQGLRQPHQLLGDVLVQRGVNEHARGGAARLPLPVHVHALDGSHSRFLRIGVGEDDDGIFAAKLETHPLQTCRRLLGDDAAGGHRSDKADALDIRMAHQRGADLAVARHDVDDTGWEYSIAQLAQTQA